MRIHVGTQVSVIESCFWEKSLWCDYERLRKVRVAIVQEKALIVMGEVIRNPLQLRAVGAFSTRRLAHCISELFVHPPSCHDKNTASADNTTR